MYWENQQISLQLNKTDQTAEDEEQNDLLFIALFALGLAIANEDGEIFDIEISGLSSFLNNINNKGCSSPKRDVQITKLIHNPPNLDEALTYIDKLDNPDYRIFEKLIEVIANSDGKFCEKEKLFLDKFRQKVGRTIVVPVIATMSSGKSTLINAMLGTDILPSANQACTSTVLKVENKDCVSDWQGRYLSAQSGVSRWQSIDSTKLSKWNNEETLDIEMVGNFPYIDNKDAHLVIYDTPGPNNSMNQTHGEITQEILSNSDHACILCVLNTEQFGIDDELSLLLTLQQQSQLDKTDVIFVLNKFDKLDIETENIHEFIEKVHSYLCDLGFINPIIIPLMSKLALELRVIISSIEKDKPIPFSNRQQRRIMQELAILSEYKEQYASVMSNADLNTEIAGTESPSTLIIANSLEKHIKYVTNSPKSFTIKEKSFSINQLNNILKLTGLCTLEHSLTKKTNNISQNNRRKEMIIELTYNPYLVETVINVKGKALKHDHDLMRFCENKRLQDWIDALLKKVADQYRVRDIELTVNCTDLDSEDVEDAVNRFNLVEQDTSIRLTVNKHSQSIDKKIQELKKLYKHSQGGLFEEFRSNKLKDNFNSALSPDFEVNVIATMSSGKSTVINAILGQDLMPSKNEACTATIARIQDSSKNEFFVGKRLDIEGNILDECQNVTQKVLNGWNADKSTSLIDLLGNIKTVQETYSTRLVFIDTPGPNNSRDTSHRKTMLEAINSKPLSMVLYILNATQLNIDDDATLLKTVADEMKAGGRKAQDRFIFILNKIDTFDPERGESVSSAIQAAKKYLNENGIDNPLIIPVSAELAKLIRIARYQGEKALTRKQRNNLNSLVELFVEEDEMNMLNHVKKDINPLCFDRLSKKLKSIGDDDKERAEILSGIPIVEELFNEFLQKHALPAKIKDAVDSFRHVMAKAKSIEALNKQLQKNENDLKKAVEAVENFQDNEERINKAKEFRENIKGKTYLPSKKLKESYKSIQNKMFLLIQEKTEDFQEKIDPERAEREISRVEKDCGNFMIEIENTIQKALEIDFLAGLSTIRNDYEKYVSELLEKEFPATDDNDLIEFQKASMQMPEVHELINNNTEETLTDSSEVSVSDWYNPFSWGRTKTINTYEDRTDLSEIWNVINTQLRKAVQDNIDKSNEIARQTAEKGKSIILKSMDEIDQRIVENLDNMKKASSDKKVAKRLIRENKGKLDWYREFDERLNKILSVSDEAAKKNLAQNIHVEIKPKHVTLETA